MATTSITPTSRMPEDCERTPLLASISANDGQELQVSGVIHKQPVTTGRQTSPDLLRGLLMALMAIDHTAVTMGGYAHGTGVSGEEASTIIRIWNSDLAYTLRTLSHLCAPGFTMLLGMGVAYFVQSRTKQGWRPIQFFKHFCIRAFAIVAINTLITLPIFFALGQFVIINAVMWALAFDYLFLGCLALMLAFIVEPYLHHALGKHFSKEQASTITWHGVNFLLLLTSIIMLWINIWTSPDQGECRVAANAGFGDIGRDCELGGKFFLDLLFGKVSCPNLYVISFFPPMGWLPFALMGFVYGRVLLSGIFRTPSSTAAFNLTLSLLFASLFVSTRLFQYGNLSTHCLDTPDQRRHHAPRNQYLDSLKSFFYVTKYPPSPSFAFFTLSACYLLLALFSSLSLSPYRKAFQSRYSPLLVFGNQSLFFYGLHLLFLGFLSVPVMNSRLVHPLPDWSRAGKGIGLGWTFLVIYLVTLGAMYVACWYYGKFKLRCGRDSVWRFL